VDLVRVSRRRKSLHLAVQVDRRCDNMRFAFEVFLATRGAGDEERKQREECPLFPVS
jgi:hypothetical protein